MIRTAPVIARLFLLAIAATAGCGTAPPPCAVQGTVHINEAPSGGVYVVLVDSSNETRGSARTDKEGVFHLTVAKPGNYAVTCFKPKVTESMGDYIEGEDLLKSRYRDPNRPAAKALIAAGENVLPVIKLR